VKAEVPRRIPSRENGQSTVGLVASLPASSSFSISKRVGLRMGPTLGRFTDTARKTYRAHRLCWKSRDKKKALLQPIVSSQLTKFVAALPQNPLLASELAKLGGASAVETKSALGSRLGQLCWFPRAAEHASRRCGDLHGAPVQNLVVPIDDCQQRTSYNAQLRIGFISRR